MYKNYNMKQVTLSLDLEIYLEKTTSLSRLMN